MIKIPKGKQLRIRQNNESIVGDIPLILEEDITITVSSNFSPLLAGGNTKTINLLGQLSSSFTEGRVAFSGKFKQLGFQMWEGTDPIAFTASLGFYMGSTEANDAEIEVYRPMVKLASLVLPTEGKGGNLIGPGPSVITAIKPNQKDKIVRGRIISIEIGRVLRINNIIIKRAEPMFNNETDENGFPISGKIQLDINSVFTATVEMLTNRDFDTEAEVLENRDHLDDFYGLGL